MRRSKYGSVRTRGFASKLESRYADELLLREKAGELHIEEYQPVVDLVAGITIVPDFLVLEHGPDEGAAEIHDFPVWIDAKGAETPVFRLKCKLWTVFGPGPLRIVKAKRRGFYVDREIKGGYG